MEAATAAMTAGLAGMIVVLVCAEGEYDQSTSVGHYVEHLERIKHFRASSLPSDGVSPSATARSSNISPNPFRDAQGSGRVYRVTAYGADPTGKEDSTEAILGAIRDAVEEGSRKGTLIEGIADLGGARISLEGGKYLISRPLRLPSAGVGNLVINGGTLEASNNFPTDGYLIDLSTPPSSSSSHKFNFEFITLRDLLLDSNFRAGGIAVVNSLRTSIDNCYISRFATAGIQVSGGHETLIRNSFLGQHITAGGDHAERSFSGTAIVLASNDNVVTDIVIFSAAIGIMVSGQANTLTGVHCYNKATAFGGTGIYLKLPGLTQTRIVNCYLDYTGIVAEDPVQLLISSSFFLGDAFVLFRSIRGILNGVNIVDNMFAGSGKGVDIVQLDEGNGPFRDVSHVAVERNNVKGMKLRSTVGRGYAEGDGRSWTVDFGSILLFPDHIRHVQYTLTAAQDGLFPSHSLRNVSGNRVVVESNVVVRASVFVAVDQGGTSLR